MARSAEVAATAVGMGHSRERSRWNKLLAWMWPIGLIIMGTLMYGGLFGMPVVETDQWSGLPLTMMLSFFGMVAAYPLGVVLALGRRSALPIVRFFSIVFIEFWRGVPLITVLFMSSVMLPLFLPEGTNFDKLLRAMIGITLFQSAYMAEVVRGGLAAIPKGQYEAAPALGLSYWKSMGLIILPQALKLVILGIVNTFISLFKDTTLVLIIGLWPRVPPPAPDAAPAGARGRSGGADRRGRRGPGAVAGPRPAARAGLGDLPNVAGVRSAAAADDICTG